MSFNFKNSFCLWLVPPNSGQVRKYRFSVRSLLIVCGTLALMLTTFVFLAGDYTRVQVLRLRNHIVAEHLAEQRDGLLERAGELENQVESLQGMNSKAISKEQEVRQRLDELAAIVRSAPFLPSPLREEIKPGIEEQPAEGIGGAELDCVGLADPRCAALLGRPDDSATRDELRLKAPISSSEHDVIEILDAYIDMLKGLPFSLPVNGYINSGFGYRPSPFDGGIKMHEGVDFALGFGSHVHVTADGVVKDVGQTGTYGLMVDIAHAHGVVTRYAHLSSALVSLGERVCRGEVIGLAGSSGRSTGPHLHYEILLKNNPQNPARYFELGERLAGIL